MIEEFVAWLVISIMMSGLLMSIGILVGDLYIYFNTYFVQ